jgi:hypothetical protein
MRIKPKANQSGMALLIVLFMVSFLFVFVSANLNALAGLKREIKLVDQRQKAHWNNVSTNQVPPRAQEVKQ